jgi:hypothetical protein
MFVRANGAPPRTTVVLAHADAQWARNARRSRVKRSRCCTEAAVAAPDDPHLRFPGVG